MNAAVATGAPIAQPLSAMSQSPRTVAEALPIFLAHGSPRIVLAASLAGVVWRIHLGGFTPWDLLPVLGIFAVWPIQEWLIHVFILHFKPIQIGSRTIDFRVPKKHRAHHRDPWNYEILFIPMHSFIYSLPLLYLLWHLVTPNETLAWSGIAAHLLLALHYEWIHFMVHTRYTPSTPFYQRLWRNHRLHHFKNEHYWYGVTRLEGDRLLRTQPSAKEVPLSPTAKTLVGQTA